MKEDNFEKMNKEEEEKEKIRIEDYFEEGQEISEKMQKIFTRTVVIDFFLTAGVSPERAKELIEELEGFKTKKEKKQEEEEQELKEYFEGVLLPRINEIEEELKIRVDDERAKELREELQDLESEREEVEEFSGLMTGDDFEEFEEEEVVESSRMLARVNRLISMAEKQLESEEDTD
jgi:hypothetical protein